MAGYHGVAAQLPGPVEELAEFQIPVAVDAGIGGAALIIGVHEFVHDLPVEFLGEVEHIVPDAQPVGHTPGILHIVQGAAGFPTLGGSDLAVIQPHGGSDTFIACFLHQKSRHGAVHSAAHSNQRFHFVTSRGESEYMNIVYACPAWYSGKLLLIAHATVGMEQAPSLQWRSVKQHFAGRLSQADTHYYKCMMFEYSNPGVESQWGRPFIGERKN